MAANEKRLSAVHEALTDWALGALSARDEDNRPTLTAAEAAVIRAFLKDNDITCPPEQGTKIAELKRKLEDQRRVPAKVDPALDLGLTDGFMQ